MHLCTHMGLGFSINNSIFYIEFFGEKIDTQLIAVAKNKPLQAIIENIFLKGRITLMSICEQLKTMIQTE